MESRYIDPEDEAFNDIERQAKQRKEAVKAAMRAIPWVGLTDEEMRELWENKGWYVTMFKAVEAKLREKNT